MLLWSIRIKTRRRNNRRPEERLFSVRERSSRNVLLELGPVAPVAVHPHRGLAVGYTHGRFEVCEMNESMTATQSWERNQFRKRSATASVRLTRSAMPVRARSALKGLRLESECRREGVVMVSTFDAGLVVVGDAAGVVGSYA